jgi:hypothetical protein
MFRSKKIADRVEKAVNDTLARGGSREEALQAGRREADLYGTAELIATRKEMRRR